jgi:radical SAM protein with 4Fe4S-binding SPASM domain
MMCIHLPQLSYGEFSKLIHQKAISERVPISGSIEVTARCNLSCAHCYINIPVADKDARRMELNYQEWCSIIDQMMGEGCLWLLLTGGEPFVRHDFLDIYTYAKRNGLLITIFTNGTLITPYIADYLAEWKPFSVEISVYGYTKETYESVTGIPGSYERCIQGIHHLLDRKIPLKLKTMVMTINHHEIRDIKNWAEGLGVDFRYDPVLNPRLDGSKKPCEFRLPPDKAVEFDMLDEKRFKAWKEFIEKFFGAPDTDSLYHCGAGVLSFHIDPYGHMSPCMMSRYIGYDLHKVSFKEGWYKFISQVRTLKRETDSKCSKCKLISLCGQCPGWGQLEHDNPETPVEYLCEIAHLRAEALGVSGME